MSASLHPALAGFERVAASPVKLRVSLSAERSLRAGEPWLYEEKVQSESRRGAPGDLGVVFDRKRRFVAVGLYDPLSPIRLRVLRRGEPGPIDADFFAERIGAAVLRRRSLEDSVPPLRSDGYRLIHGESDGLPGLVCDRYAATAVFKLYSHAWMPHLRSCVEALLAKGSFDRVILRLSRQLTARPEALGGLSDGDVLFGSAPAGAMSFLENGLRFECDPQRGQKTGFFLDQRDNRARVEGLARDCRVLNVFSYSGGFSVYAARGGASEVWSLDQSRPALEAATRNFALNTAALGSCAHRTLQGDAFAEMAALAARNERFGMVIVDPPSFATRRARVEAALGSYERLAYLAGRLVEPGGVAVLASCSRAVDPDAFRARSLAGLARAGRIVRGIDETSHGLDHPLDFEASRYLKCLFVDL